METIKIQFTYNTDLQNQFNGAWVGNCEYQTKQYHEETAQWTTILIHSLMLETTTAWV